QTQCPEQRGVGAAGPEAAVGRTGRGTADHDARGVRCLPAQGHREVGQSHSGRRHQGAVMNAKASEATTFTLNGVERTITADAARSLLSVLRGELALTGSPFGCGVNQCGACNVIIDDQAVAACDTPLWAAAGK